MTSARTKTERTEGIAGHTMRWIWTDGPTQGETHEHVFHEDGTVEWHAAGVDAQSNAGPAERPAYAAMKVDDGIYIVSYLAPSGFTLTTVLNFHDHKLYGFASNEKTWSPVQGTFEVVA